MYFDMKEIVLAGGKQAALVDDEHAGWVSRYKWYHVPIKGNHYARRDTAPKYMHRAIMTKIAGRPLKPGEVIDHIDGNGLNNQAENLRLVTQQKNLQNCRHHSDSASPYIGVYYNPRYKVPYQVKITVDYRNVHLGRFETAEEAAKHRDKAVLKLFGRHVQLNFPERLDEYRAEIEKGFDPYPADRKYTSKHPGVSYQAGIKKWKATAYTKGKQIHVGVYETEDEAVAARAKYLNDHGLKDKCRVRKS